MGNGVIRVASMFCLLVAARAFGAEAPSAAFLLSVPMSVRELGMGDVSIGGDDVMRSWTNPALLADQREQGEFAAYGTSMFGTGQSRFGISGGWKLGPKWTVGGSFSSSDASFAEVNESGYETGEQVGRSVTAGGITGAYNLGFFRAGATVKLVSDKVLDDTAGDLAADAGVVLRWKGVAAGVAVRNLGPQLRREGYESPEGEALPAETRAGLSYSYEPLDLVAGVERTWIRGIGNEAGAGLEWWPAPFLGLRTGILGLGGETGNRVTVGLSGIYKKIGLDYALTTHVLGLNHHVSISYHFTPRSSTQYDTQALNVAVIDLEPKNTSSGNSAIVSDLFRGALVNAGRFNIVEKQSMDKILLEQQFQHYGCTTDDCAVKLGRLLNVRVIFVGSFGELFGKYMTVLRAVDVETGKVLFGDSFTCNSIADVQAGLVQVAGKAGVALRQRGPAPK